MSEKGADALDMRALAKATALSRATLYRRTGGRDAIIRALAERGVRTHSKRSAKAKILDAAKVVFSRRGFDAATLEQIANQAAVGEATVYRLFHDKEGLVAAFLSEISPRTAAREALEQPTGDLRADLARIAERVLTAASESPALLRLVLIESLEQGSLLARIRAHSPTRTLPMLVALLDAHVRAGSLCAIDTRQAAQAFTGMVLGFALIGPVLHGLPVPPAKPTAQQITALFLDGALDAHRSVHATAQRTRSRR